MVDIETADHGAFVHKWHIVDNPGDASNLGAYLSHDLAHDQSQIFPIIYRARQNCLRHDRDFLSQQPLQIWVEIRTTLPARQ